jgi:hypothetical protein
MYANKLPGQLPVNPECDHLDAGWLQKLIQVSCISNFPVGVQHFTWGSATIKLPTVSTTGPVSHNY